MADLPFKISVLVFIRDQEDRQLLLKREKAPNKGYWSPIGGKLKITEGESPCQCAIREVWEEVKLTLTEKNLHLFCMISEKNYEGQGHWLMFLYECKKKIKSLPPPIDEGTFGLFSKNDLGSLSIPETDRQALWPIYFKYRNHFVVMRADCHPEGKLNIVIEEKALLEEEK
jgi:8-oxo-dGTP diphosphatase